MEPKSRIQGDYSPLSPVYNRSFMTLPSPALPRLAQSMSFTPSCERSQSTASWRSPSNAIGISSPESTVDNCEEDMDLDVSDDRPSKSSCYLWSLSQRSVGKTSEIDPLTHQFSNSLSYKEQPSALDVTYKTEPGQSSLTHLTTSMRPPLAQHINKAPLDTSLRRRTELNVSDTHTVTKSPTLVSDENLNLRHTDLDGSDAQSVTESSTCFSDENSDSLNLTKRRTSSAFVSRKHDPHSTGRSSRQITKKSCCCFSLILVSVVVGVVAVLLCSFKSIKCVDKLDVSALRGKLIEQLFGQHIAIQSVIGALTDFNEDPTRRTLVMLWHGWTGVGKNYMSDIVGEQLQRPFVHKIIVPLHLAHGTVSESLDISNWITSNITSEAACHLHLFVIDEVDKTTPAALEILYTMLADLPHLSRHEPTRAIILLLSNDGASHTNQFMSEVLVSGKSRDTVQLADLRPVMDSMWLTKMIDDGVVDVVVPFLPLEKQHVVQCIEAELKIRHRVSTQDLVLDVLSYLQYFPVESELFVSTGCRRVSYLIDLLA